MSMSRAVAARMWWCLLAALWSSACRRTPAPVIHAGAVYSLLEHLDDAEIEPSPIGRVTSGVAQFGDVERSAILVQSPGRVRFPSVRIHPEARLHFAVGIGEEAGCVRPDRASFRVIVEEPPRPSHVSWAASLGSERSAKDGEVDLSAYAGRDVDLVLESEFPAAPTGCPAAWSEPVIRSASVLVRAADTPIEPLLLVRDLLESEAPPIDVGSFVDYGRLLQAPSAAAAPPSPARSPGLPPGALRFSFEVPPQAQLELSGEVLPGRARPAPSQPVRFTARIDGVVVLQRDVQPAASPIAFSRTLALDAFAGRKVDLELVTDGAGDKAISWWTSAWLRRREEVPRQTAVSGRNVLLVVVDTLRASDLGLYGGSRETSPNLDRLGQESLIFDRAVSSCSWTQPSVATLLTGLSPFEHGMVGGAALDPRVETLAEALQRQGLTTFAVSSNPIIGRREGLHRGFESFVHIPWARAAGVNEAFRDWLAGHRDTRWFAYLHYIDPHDSYDAPPPFGTAFTAGLAPLGPDKPWDVVHKMNFGELESRLTPDDVRYLRATYDGEIQYWDFAFGKLLDTLRSDGVLENTIVIVVGDHGEEFKDHGKLFHGFHLYEESVRVPMLIWAPGLVTPGRYPRVAATRGLKTLALSLAAARPLGGRDDVRAVLGSSDGLAFSHTAMALAPGTRGYCALASVTDADYKYVLRPHDSRAELYDLRRDPGETVNRVDGERELRAHYDRLLRAWLATAPKAGMAWRDPGIVERLRAIGYLN